MHSHILLKLLLVLTSSLLLVTAQDNELGGGRDENVDILGRVGSPGWAPNFPANERSEGGDGNTDEFIEYDAENEVVPPPNPNRPVPAPGPPPVEPGVPTARYDEPDEYVAEYTPQPPAPPTSDPPRPSPPYSPPTKVPWYKHVHKYAEKTWNNFKGLFG